MELEPTLLIGVKSGAGLAAPEASEEVPTSRSTLVRSSLRSSGGPE